MRIDKNKWDKLIEEHYLSCIKRRPNDYVHKHSREEMRDWWYSKLERNNESDFEMQFSDKKLIHKYYAELNYIKQTIHEGN